MLISFQSRPQSRTGSARDSSTPTRLWLTISFLWLAAATSAAAADSFPLAPTSGSNITLHGIRFLKADPPRNLVPGIYPTNVTLSAVVLAGMTTAMPEASDRWGMSEPANAFEGRLFIGDRIGRVIVRSANSSH